MIPTNKNIIDQFPGSDEIPTLMHRQDAIDLIIKVAEASRAAVDEITDSAVKTLSIEEQVKIGQMAEYLASLACVARDW